MPQSLEDRQQRVGVDWIAEQFNADSAARM